MEAGLEGLPQAFVDRMRSLLGGEANDFFASYGDAPPVALRVNLLKLSAEQFERQSPWPVHPVPWCPSGYYVATEARLGKHPYHAAGLYYLQEPSAMAVAEALQIAPGHRVLDLAAAPGGKSTHIAALLQGKGILVANEIEGARVRPLGENLERWGARNIVVTNDSPDRLAASSGASFDRVLLDAPCSGEGMFRKTPAARAEWSLAHVAGCSARQSRIMEDAAQLVAPGGLLLYSTCTFAPEENEQRISAFLAAHPGWELVDIPMRPGFEPARPDWATPRPLPELSRAVRLWPHHMAGEGHFLALLRNGERGDEPRSPYEAPAASVGSERRIGRPGRERRTPNDELDVQALAAWQNFETRSLALTLPSERIQRRGDQLYLTPEPLLGKSEVRVVRAGLWLGTVRPKRFEPAHALALALSLEEAQMVETLNGVDIERYLQGQTLPLDGPDGWVLLAVDQWPIGWGRRVRGVVKNFYPKGLRRPDRGR